MFYQVCSQAACNCTLIHPCQSCAHAWSVTVRVIGHFVSGIFPMARWPLQLCCDASFVLGIRTTCDSDWCSRCTNVRHSSTSITRLTLFLTSIVVHSMKYQGCNMCGINFCRAESSHSGRTIDRKRNSLIDYQVCLQPQARSPS